MSERGKNLLLSLVVAGAAAAVMILLFAPDTPPGVPAPPDRQSVVSEPQVASPEAQPTELSRTEVPSAAPAVERDDSTWLRLIDRETGKGVAGGRLLLSRKPVGSSWAELASASADEIADAVARRDGVVVSEVSAADGLTRVDRQFGHGERWYHTILHPAYLLEEGHPDALVFGDRDARPLVYLMSPRVVAVQFVGDELVNFTMPLGRMGKQDEATMTWLILTQRGLQERFLNSAVAVFVRPIAAVPIAELEGEALLASCGRRKFTAQVIALRDFEKPQEVRVDVLAGSTERLARVTLLPPPALVVEFGGNRKQVDADFRMLISSTEKGSRRLPVDARFHEQVRLEPGNYCASPLGLSCANGLKWATFTVGEGEVKEVLLEWNPEAYCNIAELAASDGSSIGNALLCAMPEGHGMIYTPDKNGRFVFWTRIPWRFVVIRSHGFARAELAVDPMLGTRTTLIRATLKKEQR